MLQGGNDDSGSYISGDNSSDYRKGRRKNSAAFLFVVRILSSIGVGAQSTLGGTAYLPEKYV